ncbi:tyrosine-protein phosphatase [Lactobacillus xylocopicola]|uniref:Protein-tyrosine-phosphatase n=1 Tax=Lactobacillus xylocopicola TaxID=2976676 RepID=A0ABN6SIN4_9LACO|nr:tyrosine-protein phosphatase [Lactobacillus xylocopicola]BDR59944.1 protein-tyrosine-phosphatase [Lactobacillus xylocopicola]
MSDPLVLPVKSVRNPRDLGGYRGLNGRKIKLHRLLRTGNISRISPEDERYLLNYGLTKIIDLRSPAECRQNPDKALAGVDHYAYPLSVEDNTGGNGLDVSAEFAEYRRDQYAGLQMMCQRYRQHIIAEASQENMHRIINLLAQTNSGATLYHCSEGKDRTGLVTVMLLHILGVEREEIRRDYLYSNWMLNDYRAGRDQKFKQAGENDRFRANMRVLGSVANVFLDTSLITINENFGGLDTYIVNQLQLSEQVQEELRANYLEK